MHLASGGRARFLEKFRAVRKPFLFFYVREEGGGGIRLLWLGDSDGHMGKSRSLGIPIRSDPATIEFSQSSS